MSDHDAPPARPAASFPPFSPDAWRRLEPLVDALLDAPPEERARRLAELSGGDATLRSTLERLVAECERASPLLDRPAAERFAALADDAAPAGAARVPEVVAERYRVVRELGRGGMATVYLARDLKHARDVAVKVIRPGLAATLGSGRFLREIEIAARLCHPHVVPLYDSGEADGVLYYVMPYEEGHSLRERLARDGPLPVDDAVAILRDVCDALAYAHGHGVVHRDVKPDNVLLAGRHAMVADFGVAKAATEGAGGGGSALTTAGVTLGTPAYMAPEQVAADPAIDHRADVYAVGVLAYELLTGRPPFYGEEPREVLAAHLAQAPEPVTAHRPDIPASLAAVIMRCLEKRPSDRWQSADELVACLERLVVPSGDHVAPTPGGVRVPHEPSGPGPTAIAKRRRRVGAIVLAAMTVVIPLAFTADRARGRGDPAPTLDPAKIVVVPFRVVGVDSSLRYLGEGAVDLLAARLDGEGGPLAVDSRTAISAWNRVTGGGDGTAEDARRVARAVGAGEALLATLTGVAGGQLTVTASVIPGGAGAARPVATVTGPADSLLSLLDQVATQLAARQAGLPDQALAALTSRSVPALRAYLWGRAEYRRGHEAAAIDHFSRALEIDSTFALAALDLAVATGQLLAMCVGSRVIYQVPGYRSPRPQRDHRRFAAAVEVAWRHREKLSARDLPLLDAFRVARCPQASTAREMLAALRRAADAAPDRAETHHLLGTLLLHQGPALAESDSRERAAAEFRRALAQDSTYIAPIAGLVDVAALDDDTAELRRLGALYLSRDSVGAAADYVRWRVAVGVGDAAAASAIRSRFGSLGSATLQQIVQASQMSGVALGDADSAMTLVRGRAADVAERSHALQTAYMLALNRGRPREAERLQRRRRALDPRDLAFWTMSTMAALFWDGDRATGQAAARARARRIARDTLGLSPEEAAPWEELVRHVQQQGLWDVLHGDTARAAAAVRWLRRHYPLGADFVDALPATWARRPDAEALRARLDSVALDGCCTVPLVHWVNLVAARAHEAAGRDADALRAVRRGVSRFPPQLLSTYLRDEGRLAARLGDTAGAIRAYRHYLALRSDPEPELRAEVARVRAELARLERGR